MTIPNLVGYLRLAAIPPYLVIALGSGDGRTAPAALLYLWITLGDFLDGFLARATGQYSRMGALLDPVIDRLSVLSGILVCWNFELLPRWGLAIVALREVSVLVLSEVALRRGLEIEINWVGRIGALLVFGGLFWAQVIDELDRRRDLLRRARDGHPRNRDLRSDRARRGRRGGRASPPQAAGAASNAQPQLDVSQPGL